MTELNVLDVDHIESQNIWKIYEKTQKDVDEDIKILKEWIPTQLHIPEVLDDRPLENFFLLNKCSFERTKRSIDMYYTLRSKLPHFFKTVHPNSKQLQKVMNIVDYLPLPKLTDRLYRICVLKFQNLELLEDFVVEDLVLYLFNLQEVRLKEDLMFGDIAIYDLKNVSFSFIKKITLPIIVNFVSIYEKVYSIPLKGLYCLNSPPFFSYLLAIIKTVMKPKLFDRIHVCTDDSILAKHFKPELLPKEFGGTLGTLDQFRQNMQEKFDKYSDRFTYLENLVVDENLRPEKLENDEDLGYHGNFKKLTVD